MMEMLEMHCIFFLEGLQETAGSARPPTAQPTPWHLLALSTHPARRGDAEAPWGARGLCREGLRPPSWAAWWVGSPTTNQPRTPPPTPGYITNLLGVISPTTHPPIPGSYHPPPHDAPAQVPQPDGTAFGWVPDEAHPSLWVPPPRTHFFNSV